MVQTVGSLEKRLQGGAVALESGCARISLLDRSPVLFSETACKPYVANGGLNAFRLGNRYAQPADALMRFNEISIVPVILAILDVVVHDEHVDGADNVKIAFPR